jgi:hypothetical protein
MESSVIGERTALGTTSIGEFGSSRVKLSALGRNAAILDEVQIRWLLYYEYNLLLNEEDE